jgi:enterochelin esterase-like enzyme
MHDGQMLFDGPSTWNGQEWRVDETLDALIGRGDLSPTLVVGIWNTGENRRPEYFPQKPFAALAKDYREFLRSGPSGRNKEPLLPNPVSSDDYLRFLVNEVKPYIDSTFNTYQGPDHTFIAGSSMGGLISMYGFFEYPDVFGGAACMSTHWPGRFTVEKNPIPDTFLKYLDYQLNEVPKDRKIYFDCGDQTLDSLYGPLQDRVDSLFAVKGYPAALYRSIRFPGKGHTESAWAERLAIPLTFLLREN